MNINIQESQNNTSTRDNTSTGHFEWTNEMKINLLRIEEQERSRGRRFMKKMKEAWDPICEEKPMSAQCLRDNAARFRKNEAVTNLIEVRDERDLERDQAEKTENNNENSQNEYCDVHDGHEDHENKQDVEDRGVEE